MPVLTKMQEDFCTCVALYGFRPADAAKEAGYSATCPAMYHSIGRRLVNNIHIASRIAEMREEIFDPEKMKRSIILKHLLAQNFDQSRVVYNKTELTDDGIPFTRVVVEPTEKWPWEARQLFTGRYDKYNRPIFRDPVDATKELSKIFGLYKDGGVREEEDTDKVLSSAGLDVDVGTEYDDDSQDDWDMSEALALDRELGVADEPQAAPKPVAEPVEEDDDDAFDWCDIEDLYTAPARDSPPIGRACCP